MEHICVISGSHRKVGSYKVANFVSHLLQNKQVQISNINLCDDAIPLRDESRRDVDSDTTALLQPVRDQLISATGFVIISPERGGMVAPALKNLFLLASDRNEFAHKAGLLIGVSSGSGGAYPIAELRSSSYKNSKICYLPDHVIIRDVENVLNTHTLDEQNGDIRIEKRIDRSLDMLLEYSQALTNLRSTTSLDLMKHPHGM